MTLHDLSQGSRYFCCAWNEFVETDQNICLLGYLMFQSLRLYLIIIMEWDKNNRQINNLLSFFAFVKLKDTIKADVKLASGFTFLLTNFFWKKIKPIKHFSLLGGLIKRPSIIIWTDQFKQLKLISVPHFLF